MSYKMGEGDTRGGATGGVPVLGGGGPVRGRRSSNCERRGAARGGKGAEGGFRGWGRWGETTLGGGGVLLLGGEFRP